MNPQWIVEYSVQFGREYGKLIRRNSILEKQIDKCLRTLSLNPFSPTLKTHKVNTSTYGSVWSSRVTGDIRI
jgi:mRNA-degrading endonuclease YafQ of YafQ-DinJ toxin-antitoxin module